MIGGDPDVLDAAARELEQSADTFLDARQQVESAVAGGLSEWRGEAADAARAALREHAHAPVRPAGALTAAGPILREFAVVLREAKAAYQRGEQLAGLVAPAVVALSGTGSVGQTEGLTTMRAAQDRVRVAAEIASAKLQSLSADVRGAAPVDPVLPDDAVPPVGAQTAPSGPAPVAGGGASASGPAAGSQLLGPANGKLMEAKFFADLARADAHGARSLGDALMSGRAEAQVGAQFTGAAAVTESGAAATMAAAAGARARASGRIDAGPFAAHGRGEGMAGAEARVVAAASPQEIGLKAGAFAGAKGKVGMGGDVGGIGLATTAEGWAGIGAEVDANIGKGDDGKYGVEVGAGAAVIPGGKLGFELSIDPGKVEQTYHETADAVAEIGTALDRSWDAGQGRISQVLDDAF